MNSNNSQNLFETKAEWQKPVVEVIQVDKKTANLNSLHGDGGGESTDAGGS